MLLETVADALKQTGLEPRYLEHELTETALIRDEEIAAKVIGQIARLGVLFSIEDFGTGYSSLKYLKQLSIQKLKIDQSFVRNLPHDPDDAVIVRATIALGRELGLRVIPADQNGAFFDCRIRSATSENARPLEVRVWTRTISVGGSGYEMIVLRGLIEGKCRELLDRAFFHDALNSAAGLHGLLELANDLDGADALENADIALQLSARLVQEVEAYRELVATDRRHWTSNDWEEFLETRLKK